MQATFPAKRRSLTLIELLVVVVILVTVTAAVIPAMAPDMETRRIREAARGLTLYCAGARARAIQNGRPVGVFIAPLWVDELKADVTGLKSRASVAMGYAEVPPPYAGDTTDATVKLKPKQLSNGNMGWLATFGYQYGNSFQAADLPYIVRYNDTMKVNYQGVTFRIVGGGVVSPQILFGDKNLKFHGKNGFDLELHSGTGVVPTWPSGESPPMAYQIFRQAVLSAVEPYQLPDGVVIDMEGSGEASIPGFYEGDDGELNLAPMAVMFSPSGSVDLVYSHRLKPHRPTGAVFLLIGKRENVPISQNAGRENWRDMTNLWVTIGHQTGQVNVSEMAPTSATSNVAAINESRRFAREGRGIGGR